MPINLIDTRVKLILRLSTLDRAFDRHIAVINIKKNVDRFAFQEGLFSALWQSWCHFCRDIAIKTAQGAHTANGTFTNSPAYSFYSEKELAYIAKKLAFLQPVGHIRPLSGTHLEPTWGDIARLTNILNGFASTNLGTMMSGFSGAVIIKDLQVFRNASAHISQETINLVKATRVRYNKTNFMHPSDAMRWIDPVSNDFLWRSLVDEMRDVSDFVIQ